MKIATIIVRILLGLMFLFASITFFFPQLMAGAEMPKMSDNMQKFNTGLEASGYLMNLVKTLELLCGIAFVSGRFVALANLVILPITINILLVHVFMGPENVPVAAALLAANLFLIYSYWGHYKTVMSAK